MEVAIGDIGGSYFTDVEVTNVTTLQPAPVQKLVSLELKRMRVSYNLLTILEGLNAFLGNAAFEVDTAELEFDLTRQNTRESAPPVLLISMETFGSMATNCWWNRFKPIPDRVNPTFEFLVDNVKKSLRKRL
jgi:hypothetical protein